MFAALYHDLYVSWNVLSLAFFTFQLLQLNNSHCAELAAARSSNRELQDRLESMTSGVLQLKSTLMEVSAERDGLKEHLRYYIQFKTEEIYTCNALCCQTHCFFLAGVFFSLFFFQAKWDKRLRPNRQHWTASEITSASSPRKKKRRNN